MPLGVAAPIIAGWSFDQTGSYATVFTLWAVLVAAGAGLVAVARRPVGAEPTPEGSAA